MRQNSFHTSKERQKYQKMDSSTTSKKAAFLRTNRTEQTEEEEEERDLSRQKTNNVKETNTTHPR
jgi:hypothetical protein